MLVHNELNKEKRPELEVNFLEHAFKFKLAKSTDCHSVHANVIPYMPMSFRTCQCHSVHANVITL